MQFSLLLLTLSIALPVLSSPIPIPVAPGDTTWHAYDCGAPFCYRKPPATAEKRQYDCGAPFCAEEGVVEKRSAIAEASPIAVEDVVKKLAKRPMYDPIPMPTDPYACGAPFCGRDALPSPNPASPAANEAAKELAKRPMYDPVPMPKDPYACGAPFCGRDVAEGEVEKRSATAIEERQSDPATNPDDAPESMPFDLEIEKRQYDCGAPFCDEFGKAKAMA